jgi:hypothetical protein
VGREGLHPACLVPWRPRAQLCPPDHPTLLPGTSVPSGQHWGGSRSAVVSFTLGSREELPVGVGGWCGPVWGWACGPTHPSAVLVSACGGDLRGSVRYLQCPSPHTPSRPPSLAQPYGHAHTQRVCEWRGQSVLLCLAWRCPPEGLQWGTNSC